MHRRVLAFLACALVASACRANAPTSDADAQKPASSGASAVSSEADPWTLPPPESSAAPGGSADVRRFVGRRPSAGMPEPPAPPSAAATAEDVVSIFDAYGFPAHMSVVHLCRQRVYPQGGRHLTWDAFASTLDPATLIAHYQKRLGDAGFSAENGGGSWKLPAGAVTPTRTLTVFPPSAQGPFRSCEKKPDASAKSVVVISRDH